MAARIFGTRLANWQHSTPSVVGYPSNGVQTYEVTVPSGRVTSWQPATINSLTLDGGLIVLDAPLTVRSNFIWSGGDFTGLARLTVENGISLTGGGMRQAPASLRSYGTALIDGPEAVMLSGRWDHFGPMEWRGVGAVSNYGALFSHGSFVKSGPGELTFGRSARFDTHGYFHLQEGALRIRNEGQFSGRIRLDAGTTLSVNVFWLSASNTYITGPGTIRIDTGPDDYLSLFGGGSDGVTVLSNLTVEVGPRGGLGDYSQTIVTGSFGALVIGSDVNVLVRTTNDPVSSWFGAGVGGPQTTNFGVVSFQGSGEAGAGFHNHGLVEFQGALNVNTSGMNNRGLLRKIGGESLLFDDGYSGAPLTNHGVVQVQDGLLRLKGRGAGSGSWIAEAGATNRIEELTYQANFHFLDGTRFLGAGRHEIDSVCVDGIVTNESTLLAVKIRPESTGLLFNTSSGVLQLVGAACKIINDGLAVSDLHPDYYPYYSQTSVSDFWNRGILRLDRAGLNGVVRNDGLVLKATTNKFVLAGTMVNSNTIEVSAGSLLLSGHLTNAGALIGTGLLTVAESGSLTIAAPTTNLAPLRVEIGRLNLVSNLTVGSSLHVPDTYYGPSLSTIISGPGDLIVASNATASLAHGDVLGPGRWRINPGGQTYFNTPSTFARNIVNDGLVQMSGALRAPGVTFLNRGIVHAQGSIFSTGAIPTVILNQDQWIVASNSGFSFDTANVAFTNWGQLIVRGSFGFGGYGRAVLYGSGETILEGGSLSGDHFMPGGTLRGDGTAGTLVTHGTIRPERRIHVGELKLGSGARVRFDLGGTNAGVNYPMLTSHQLYCSNNVTIDVRLANGFMPQAGDTFEVMQFSWRYVVNTNGVLNFPRYTGLNLPNGLRLAPILTDKSLTFRAVPQPENGQVRVNIQRGSFGSMLMHWPPECVGFFVQYTTNLSQPWTTYRMAGPEQPIYIGGSSPTSFYRLADPSGEE